MRRKGGVGLIICTGLKLHFSAYAINESNKLTVDAHASPQENTNECHHNVTCSTVCQSMVSETECPVKMHGRGTALDGMAMLFIH